MSVMIVNAATGEVVERDRTPDEQAQYEADVAAAQAAQQEAEAAQAADAAARESAAAKLSALGLNDAEIKAIVGGEIVSPETAPEPEPEPEPEGAFKYTTSNSVSPTEGYVRAYRNYLKIGNKDLDGQDFNSEFMKIARVKISGGKPYDKTIPMILVQSGPYWTCYGHDVPDYADVNAAKVDVTITLKNNVLWTDQVINVIGGNNISPGGVYYYNNQVRVYPVDADGNPWPIPVAGSRVKVSCPERADQFFLVTEVIAKPDVYFVLQVDKSVTFYNGKAATMEIVE